MHHAFNVGRMHLNLVLRCLMASYQETLVILFEVTRNKLYSLGEDSTESRRLGYVLYTRDTVVVADDPIGGFPALQ